MGCTSRNLKMGEENGEEEGVSKSIGGEIWAGYMA